MATMAMVLAAATLLLLLLLRAADRLWWAPRRLERALRAQGLDGTPYRFLYGDVKESFAMAMDAMVKSMPFSHDISPRVSPFLHRSMERYGKISFTWRGTIPRVTITDPELARKMLSSKFGHFGKPVSNPVFQWLVAGLATYEGEKWAKHRRILNPAFHAEKLRQMHPAFGVCRSELVDRWDSLVGPEGFCELDVWPEMQNFTGDVISRAAFGSSFEEGRRVFQLQSEQGELIIQSFRSVIPGYRFLPTTRNMRMREIDREVRGIVRGIIGKREKEIENGITNHEDLLGLLMESNLNEQQKTSPHLRMTTEEVTMILYEVLRLYPPGPSFSRRTCKTMELGGITYPEGVTLMLPSVFIHHDPEFWGEDANEFKPDRFAEGVSKASKNQAAFLPFGWGLRICIGQNFVMMEAKMGLSMILQRFSFELSPSYAHAPYTVISLHPQHGAQVILHKL